jgi:hypothetical protein
MDVRVLLAAAVVAALLAPAAAQTAPKRPLAPNIKGTTLDGKKITLAQFRGRPVFINVWSSW